MIGILLQPIIPDSAKKILDMLGVKTTLRLVMPTPGRHIDTDLEVDFKFISSQSLKPGISLPAPSIVFPKIEG